MKVIKDAMMEWLDQEIAKPNPPRLSGKDIQKIRAFKIRRITLEEVRAKLQETIIGEFAKLEKEK